MADKPSPLESPPVLTLVLIVIVMAFATVGWFGARDVMAALYGLVRSVQLPYFDQFIPYADRFELANLRRGMQPEFASIYLNALYYGLFATVLTLCVMFAALTRLAANDIRPAVQVRSDLGRSYRDVLDRYAVTEPSVRFFADYDVLDLPTNIGSARQNHTAMELLFLTGALRGVVQNTRDGRPAHLDIDDRALGDWFLSRFGPRNPFYGMTNDKLADLEAIRAAVDDLGWAEALILYPAVLRIYGFHVEENKEGFEATNAMVEGVIADTWSELNRLKTIYGDGITLGFADETDRQERIERHRNRGSRAQRPSAVERRAAKEADRKRKNQMVAAERDRATAERDIDRAEAEMHVLEGAIEDACAEERAKLASMIGDLVRRIEKAVADRDDALARLEALAEGGGRASTSTRTVSTHEVVHLLGVAEREANSGRPRPMIARASLGEDEMVDLTAARPGTPEPPRELQFFGEVLSRYAERGFLKSVVTAREQLKELLTIHLTERTKRYPVRLGPDGRTVFSPRIDDREEQAFNHKAQLRLAEYAKALEGVLMTHAYQFGIVGGALNEARRSGIMPPNCFRWMRFCPETETLWWFVHNLGMPSAVPENAGLFEHFQMEVAAGSAITRPYVREALKGVRAEAERYLTPGMIEEIRSVLGKNAVIDELVKLGRLEQEARDRDAARSAPAGITVLADIIEGVESRSLDDLDEPTKRKDELPSDEGRPRSGSFEDADDLDDMFG